MNFLLDTNILIYALQKQAGEAFHNFLFQLSSRGISFISVISRFELLAGTLEINRKSNVEFLSRFPLLELTGSIADRAGDLFRQYRKKGITLDNEDLFLTATVEEHELVLVTTNDKHFSTLNLKEQHHISFQTRKGKMETKLVSMLAPA